MRLLVVVDDASVREALALVLDLNGFEVETAADGREAIRALALDPRDAVVLDVLMPGLDGLEVCRRLRAIGDRTPVLMLTARAEVSERVAGLEAGADDYMAKPFAHEELVARLRALLRRTGWEGDDRVLRFEDLELDPGAHEARRAGRVLELTRTEFLLLELLMLHPRQVLTRAAIFDRVWGYDFGPASNSLEVYVGYLRRKTEAEGEPRLVHTVRQTAPAGKSATGAGAGVKVSETAGQPVGMASATRPAPGSGNQKVIETRAKLVLPKGKLGGATGYVQLYQTDGRVVHSEEHGSLLPVTAATRAVAAGKRVAFFSEVTVAGTPVRMLTERAAPGGVWQIALPLSDLSNTLSHLRLVLALVCLGGIALAAALGLLVSRVALAPVRRLRGAAERVTRTQDLAHRIDAGDSDDLGRLAGSFNTMLAALERARLAQRQLVSDASHELRTPLTSVRANLDALALGEQLPAHERERIVAAAQAQLRELTVLVGDLVDLSKTDVEEVEVEDVRLDLAVAGAVARARLHAPGCRFALDLAPCLVRAAPGRLDRAIANLLDNACQWNPATPDAAPIEVRVRDGALKVRDHGPGIAEDDLTRVFDRFYRAPDARALPGSGLGLAIVRQFAESHAGAVHAANDPAGGARLTLELPPLDMTEAELNGADAAVASSPRTGSSTEVAPGRGLGAVHQAPRML
jgi:two-component system sensor histidine kinase MprB